MIVVDAGDFAGPASEAGKLKTDLIRKVMDYMGYDVAAVGERELAYGYDYFQTLFAPSEMKVVNSNIVRAEDEKDIAKEYAILDEGGVKVGFFSLYFDQTVIGKRDVIEGNGFVVEDAVETAKRILPELHKKCDIVVLIAHGPWSKIDMFLGEVSDFDFVISAHEGGLDRAGHEINGTTVMKAGSRGQYVCKATFVVSPDGAVSLSSTEAIGVKTNLPEDPEVVRMIKDMNGQYNDMRRAETLAMQEPRTAKKSADKYLGDAVCRRCHEDVYQAWLGTPHAAAYGSLEEKGMQAESDCVMCHTTGSGDPTGFMPPSSEELKASADGASSDGGSDGNGGAAAAPTVATDDLRNVQCEACHGKGTSHQRGETDFLQVSESECAVCHDPKNSPDFNYREYLPHVSCKVLLEDSD